MRPLLYNFKQDQITFTDISKKSILNNVFQILVSPLSPL